MFRYNWDIIENLNIKLGITRDTCIVDDRGYLRWKSNNRLCHRVVAYNYIYNSSYPKRFSDYEVHHKDGNKFNNNPDNLEILSWEAHDMVS